jgi:ABC-type amino acid transport substrate-binding protein
LTLPRRRLLLAFAGAAAAVRAEGAPLFVLIDNTVQLPQALIRGGAVVDGLQHDIARELGRRLARPVQFRVVPRRRVGALLAAGDEADLICNYLPAWLPGPLQWSQPFLDDGELLITAARRRPAPLRLEDVAGRRIGTIGGFAYVKVEAALGARFLRDDAPSLEATLRKLAAGRIDHALVGRQSFDYLRRRGALSLALHPPLPLSRWRTACALSPRSTLTPAELDVAIAAMRADGSLARLLDRYR